LVEVLMAVMVTAILFVGIYNTFHAQQRAYLVQYRMAEMTQNARIALEVMSKGIRNAAFNPQRLFSSQVDVGFQTATSTTVIFTQDIDGDGAVASDGEWLGYRFVEAARLIEKCTGSTQCSPWVPFVDNVERLEFRYLLQDGSIVSAPANPDDIREVEITLVASPRTDLNGQIRAKTIVSSVQVRNLALQ
jgi:type II secretory pathway component PulJ